MTSYSETPYSAHDYLRMIVTVMKEEENEREREIRSKRVTLSFRDKEL